MSNNKANKNHFKTEIFRVFPNTENKSGFKWKAKKDKFDEQYRNMPFCFSIPTSAAVLETKRIPWSGLEMKYNSFNILILADLCYLLLLFVDDT